MEPPWKTRIVKERRGRAEYEKWKKGQLVKETRTGSQHLSYLSSMPVTGVQCWADYSDDPPLRKECVWRKPRLLVSSLFYHLRRFRDYEPSSGTRTPEWGLAIHTLSPLQLTQSSRLTHLHNRRKNDTSYYFHKYQCQSRSFPARKESQWYEEKVKIKIHTDINNSGNRHNSGNRSNNLKESQENI